MPNQAAPQTNAKRGGLCLMGRIYLATA